jgi:hypothetical protein
MPELPKELLAAIARGELTEDQLRQLIEIEALAMGLTLDEAVERAQAGTLPKDVLGTDLEQLVELLVAA